MCPPSFAWRRVETTLCWRIPALELGQGSYTVSVALHGDMTHVANSYDWWDKAALIEVVRGPGLCLKAYAT